MSFVDFSSPGCPTDKHTVPVKAFTIPSYEDRPFRVTSVSYSADESELLVSYSSDHLYLFDATKEVNCASSFLTCRFRGIHYNCVHFSKGIDIKRTMDKYRRVAAKNQQPNGNGMPPVRRLRLRGDWSDTGPDARPERELGNRVSVGQARPQLQATIMRRMTEVLSRMMADPRTRINLSSHGNEITHESDVSNLENFLSSAPTTSAHSRHASNNSNSGNLNITT